MQTKAMPVFRKTVESFTAGAKTLPRNYFICDEVFKKEQERIFANQWLCAGHQSQLAKAGDYFLTEILGESVIIVRDQKGRSQAFYNVCRHRGTRMCEEKSGQFRESIRCPYHAWTYALDGRLMGAPHMDKIDG